MYSPGADEPGGMNGRPSWATFREVSMNKFQSFAGNPGSFWPL
jgi:hypothetical protein